MSDQKNPGGSAYTGASRSRISLAHTRHTLRTPLNHIIGYSEMLLEEADERGLEAFAADLQKIHSAGKQLLSCINELLDPAMIDQASAHPSKTATIAGLFREQEPWSQPLPPSHGASPKLIRPHIGCG